MPWEDVVEALPDAKAIAFDGCHKIYVLMDDTQVAQMRDWGYDPLVPVTDPAKALATLEEWYAESCGLRFIEAIRTVDGDPNEGFTNLISQFEE